MIDVRIAEIPVSVKINGQGIKVGVNDHDIIVKGDTPSYKGDTVITPTEETQILNTKDFKMESNIEIKPIPSNYGKISYDGFKILIS